MHSLEKLEEFLRLLHEVLRVKRVSRLPNEKEMTNTGEHTFEMVMLCWYIAATQKLDLDMEQVLKYALAHDIVEAYAGDTFVYDEEAKKTKAERERKALARIESEFPEFTDMTESIHEYERRESKEAKFVYAVDKLVDPLSASMEETQSIWKEFDVSFDALLELKTAKIAESNEVTSYWQQLVKKLETRREFFFNN